MFNEKLSFLMIITNTSNSDLASAIPVSESCVSRWRTGKRNLPKNSFNNLVIINYFYKKIITDKLEYKFSDIELFKKSKDFKVSLTEWLFDKNIKLDNENINLKITNSTYYYGDDGKRQAVIRFLNNIKDKTNQTGLSTLF